MNNEFENMNAYTVARWAALIDGVNLVIENANIQGIKTKNINFKQLALKKYIDSMSDSICKQLMDNKNPIK